MPNKIIGKKRVKVQEVEEVETRDRRGKVKVTLRPVKKTQPPPKQPSPNNPASQKHVRHNSPSPSGSNPRSRKPKTSKVLI
jgi:hypothetical protein